MPQYYHMSDIAVVPSICNEGFGMVALEALAAGKPVIATRTGGMADFLNDDNSIQVTPGSTEELENAILKILSDAGLYFRLASHTKARIKEFCWEDAVEKILLVYTQ